MPRLYLEFRPVRNMCLGTFFCPQIKNYFFEKSKRVGTKRFIAARAARPSTRPKQEVPPGSEECASAAIAKAIGCATDAPLRIGAQRKTNACGVFIGYDRSTNSGVRLSGDCQVVLLDRGLEARASRLQPFRAG